MSRPAKPRFIVLLIAAVLLQSILGASCAAAAEEIPAVKAYSDIPVPVLAASQAILNLRNPPPNDICSAIMLEGRKILTAGHCVQDQERKDIDLKDTGIFLGESMIAHGPRIIRKEMSVDLALLEPRVRQRTQRRWTPLSIAAPRTIAKGDEFYVVGLRTGIRRARVTVPPGKGAFFELEPINAEEIICEPGDSGGAIVDDQGGVVGVISGNLPRMGRSQACEIVGREYLVKLVRGESITPMSPEDILPEQDLLYGDYSLRVRNFEAAIGFYNQAARYDREALEANLGLCALQKRREDYGRALEYCRKANALQPSDLGTMELLAAVYLKLERLDAAYDYAKKVLEVAPNDGRALIRVGAILEKQHKYKAAMVEYSKALDRAHLDEPNQINAYGGLVYCSENLLNYREAWSYIHKAKNDGVYVKPEVTDWLRKQMAEPIDEDK